MPHTNVTMISRFRHALLIVPFLSGCVESDSDSQDFRNVSLESRMSLQDDLRTFNTEDIIFSYREGDPTMEVLVDLARFARHAGDHTVEMSAQVVLPDGETWPVKLAWTHSEDERSPRLEIPMVGLGQYEVVVGQLAIDGRVIPEGPVASHGMKLLADDSGGSVNAGNCSGGGTYVGAQNNPIKDVFHGSSKTDYFYGHGGDDAMYGYGCADYFHGGGGIDACYGGGGVDHFSNCETANQGAG